MPGVPTIQERTHELLKLTQGKEKDRAKLSAALERLQTRFDQDAEDFQTRAHECLHNSKPFLIGQLAMRPR